MRFQLLDDLLWKATSIPQPAVPFDVPAGTHSGDDCRDRIVAQHIAQRRFRHLVQTDPQVSDDLLHTCIDLLLSITSKISASEVAVFKPGLRGYLPRQAAFV